MFCAAAVFLTPSLRTKQRKEQRCQEIAHQLTTTHTHIHTHTERRLGRQDRFGTCYCKVLPRCDISGRNTHCLAPSAPHHGLHSDCYRFTQTLRGIIISFNLFKTEHMIRRLLLTHYNMNSSDLELKTCFIYFSFISRFVLALTFSCLHTALSFCHLLLHSLRLNLQSVTS